jgi:membrane protease YdiL (CAAX protease family)
LAVAASTVVFAVAHEHNTGDTAQLLAVGAMAGISYARTRNLATSIVVHASFNLGVLVLYALWTHS